MPGCPHGRWQGGPGRDMQVQRPIQDPRHANLPAKCFGQPVPRRERGWPKRLSSIAGAALMLGLSNACPALSIDAMDQWRPDIAYRKGMLPEARVSITKVVEQKLITIYIHQTAPRSSDWMIQLCSQMLVDLSLTTQATVGGPVLIQIFIDGKWNNAIIRGVEETNDYCTRLSDGRLLSDDMRQLISGREMSLRLSPAKQPDNSASVSVPLEGLGAALREAEDLARR